jgi:uncharacterized membrane protein
MKAPSGRYQATSIVPSSAASPVRNRSCRSAGWALRESDRGLAEIQERVVEAVPVGPPHRIVLAIGIVVALLAIAELVAAEQHRHALAEHQRRDHVAPAAVSGGKDASVVGRAFGAHIVRMVVGMTVAVVLAIRLIVLAVIGDGIHQREAVMGTEQVDRGGGAAVRMV